MGYSGFEPSILGNLGVISIEPKGRKDSMSSRFLAGVSVVVVLAVIGLGATACDLIDVGSSGLEVMTEPPFSMPSFFGNGMLFQQEKEMKLWGKAPVGSRIKAELYKDESTRAEESAIAAADSEGNWSLAFSPRAGSYDSYRIKIFEGKKEKITLKDVVVGELWLATGQSNMRFEVTNAVGGTRMLQEAKDPYIRVLLEPYDPYGYRNDHPSTPDYDVVGCRWGYGNKSTDLTMISAMAYIAVLEMRKELDVPVGFINAAVGGTGIQAWLSRESIEGSPSVYETLVEKSLYISPEAYDSEVQPCTDMSACYNTKIGPLAGMNIAGLMWCQGETNCLDLPNEKGFYSAALQALVKGYSEDFGFEDPEDMPVLLAHIAPYNYNRDYAYIAYWIEEVTDACKVYPNINQLPLYDADLVYKDPPTVGYAPIHPSDKSVIGQRIGRAALHNVYNVGKADYYAPTVKSVAIEGDRIIVSFDSVAEGLRISGDGNDIHGFSICNEKRKFAPATAKVISKDTVEVYSSGVKAPVAVTYAFASFNSSANLVNSYGLPAIPFRSDEVRSVYLAPIDWITCDSLTVWVSTDAAAGHEPAWSVATINGSQDVTVEIDNFTRVEGEASLKLTYSVNAETGNLVGVGPNLHYFLMPHNLHQYNYISVLVRNEDDRDKEFSLLLTTGNRVKWKVRALNPQGEDKYTHMVPARSGFTTYVFDLTDIVAYDSDKTETVGWILSKTSKLQFTVKDTAGGAIYLDGITLGFAEPSTISFPYL